MRKLLLLASCVLPALTFASPGTATTLEEALVYSYRTNPGLQTQRDKLLAIDESYVQARAEFSPTLSVQVQGDYSREHQGREIRLQELQNSTSIPDYLEQNSVTGQLVVSQPLYTSGRFAADLKAADAGVRSGREALRTAEANLLFNVIQVYTSVARDQEALDIRTLNLSMLKHQVAETVARQKAGEVTRTDVAQAEAQLASEDALYQASVGQLNISRANYKAVVGTEADDLLPPPDIEGLPETFDAAIDSAERNNPDLRQTIYNEQASKARVYASRANGGPTLSAQLRGGYNGSAVPFTGHNLNKDVSLTANLTIPLYSGGVQSSQVRQALDQNYADQDSIEDVHRGVIQNVSIAWNQMLIAQAAVEAQQRQVAAATIAFEGMRKEYSNGDRSTLDVLIAEETLRDAELALISARHDQYVAKAAILQNMGWLELQNLVHKPRLYEPEDHLKNLDKPLTNSIAGLLRHVDGAAVPTIAPIRVTRKPATDKKY